MIARHLAVMTVLLTACATTEPDTWDFADGKSDGSGAISYGALAVAKVPASFDQVKTGLVVIDADVLPHEAKKVRKQIAELRDYVDLFVYAYSNDDGDPWRAARNNLDNGYETIGAFKDLYDRQGIDDPALAVYDQAELDARRAEVLAWTGTFAERATDFRAYLAAPSQSRLYDRPHKQLSPYFWGATELEPSLSRSGLKNMAKLTRDLLEHAFDDYGAVMALRELHVPENQEHFHAFRKRIRSIARMPGYFAEIVKREVDIESRMKTVESAVDKYGDLNDKITRYVSQPSDELAAEIATDWTALRDWQTAEHFDVVLDEIRDSIRN